MYLNSTVIIILCAQQGGTTLSCFTRQSDFSLDDISTKRCSKRFQARAPGKFRKKSAQRGDQRQRDLRRSGHAWVKREKREGGSYRVRCYTELSMQG